MGAGDISPSKLIFVVLFPTKSELSFCLVVSNVLYLLLCKEIFSR